jgi:hypothetical protein
VVKNVTGSTDTTAASLNFCLRVSGAASARRRQEVGKHAQDALVLLRGDLLLGQIFHTNRVHRGVMLFHAKLHRRHHHGLALVHDQQCP